MEMKFTTLDLLQIDANENNLKLKCIAGKKGLDREINTRKINRPGLALGGFFDYFSYQCIQVFGRGEAEFIEKHKNTEFFANIKKLMSHEIPCCLFANNKTPSEDFCTLADNYSVPILVSELETVDLVSILFEILNDTFALRSTIHGGLVEVFGIGVLLLGKSGIGKSETALELLERGHRLVADDTIEIKALQKQNLIGRGTRIIAHHMEIKGIGIINVKNMFGIGAVRDEKRIQLVIELEEWNPDKEYDRMGAEDKFIDFLGIKIPYLLIPVMPGRNIPIIIETAAMNQRLKMMGVNAAKNFNRELMEYYETEEIKNSYFYNKE